MPPASEILEQLAAMSSTLAPLAAAWHVAIIAIAAAIVAGWRPTQLVFATLLLAPLVLSVASLALAFGNAFNGASFALLALGMLVLGGRLSDERAVTRGPLWTTLLGGALILFGACYPHFVAGPWYLVPAAAPVGIVPCPTLAVLAGATLITNGGGDARRVVRVLRRLRERPPRRDDRRRPRRRGDRARRRRRAPHLPRARAVALSRTTCARARGSGMGCVEV